MTRYTRIDLAALPAPPVVEALDYEAILDAALADLAARAPEAAAVLDLESEPLVKLMQVFAYREVLLRQRINDAARAVMLPYAVGADLDNLAAIFGVQRLTLTPADPATIPPTPAVMETDDDFRGRVQLALEAQSTAGPRGAYEFWALGADADVKDVGVDSPAPGEVRVTVLSRQGDGTPSAAVLTAVTDALNAEEVRPLTDLVTVQAATIVPFTVDATLYLYHGPDSGVVLAEAEASLDAYLDQSHAIGRDVTVSGIHAALHVSGVQRVALAQPGADLVVAATEAAWCTARTLTFGGRDE